MANNKYTIPWGDGSDEKIYLDMSEFSSKGIIRVDSDENSSKIDRSRIITITASNLPAGKAYLKLYQGLNNLVIATFDDTASLYNDTKAGYSKSL